MATRDSAYRNVYAEVWAPSSKYLEVKVNKSSTPLVRANATYYAVPWATAGGGSLGVFPLGKAGKLNGNFLIRAHQSPILAFDFHSSSETLVATGSRDPEIKLWKFPEGGLTEDIKEPVRVLAGHSKRIANLRFHPYANNVLLTSGGESTCKLWDINAGEAKIELKGYEDVVTAFDWAMDSAIAAAAKEKLLIFDPRASTNPIGTQTPHESAKGFELAWLSGVGAGGGVVAASGSKEQYLATVGWSKASDRQLAIWDSRKLGQPLNIQVVDVSSSQLSPFFDPDTGLLYLSEKGTRTYVYEMVGTDPYAYQVCKYDAKSSQSGAALIPKRAYNVMNCETARFLMVGNDSIETVSFFVPRKDKSLFQEDIYPLTLSGLSSMSASEWFGGKNSPPGVISLKPAGVQSVYDVSEELGGRSKAKDKQRAAATSGGSAAAAAAFTHTGPLTEGDLFLGNEGWVFTTWAQCFVTIRNGETFFVFENRDAGVPLHTFTLATLATLRTQDDNDLIFEIGAAGAKPVKIKASSKGERDAWIDALNAAKRVIAVKKMEDARLAEAQQLASSTGLAHSASGNSLSASQNAASLPALSGYLLRYTEGFFYNYWNKNYFKIANNALHCSASESAEATIEQVLLDKVISVYEANNIENAPFCFKIATATRTWMLRASDDSELKKWVEGLEAHIRFLKRSLAKNDEEEDSAGSASSTATVVEGFLQIKTGLWSLWSKSWVTVVGGDILLFKQPTAPQPHTRLQFAKAQTLEISDRDVEQAFMMRFHDGTTYHFLATTRAERDEWLSSLAEIRTALNTTTVDMMAELGLTLGEVAKLNLRQIEDALTNVVDINKVKAGAQPVLIRIQGKRLVRAGCVEISPASLFQDNVYLLDLGGVVYQWNGKKASRMLKAKGLDISTRIKQKERGGNCQVRTIDQGTEDEAPQFWTLFGGKKDVTQFVAPELADKDEDPMKLYRVTDKKVSLIHQGKLPSKDRLDSRFCFIAETKAEVFIWQGRGASKDSKKLSLVVLSKLQARKKGWHIVLRVIENGETALWKEKFKDYPGELPIATTKQTIVSNISQKREQKPIDIKAMHTGVAPAAALFDDGRGKLQIWRVLEFDKEVVPETLFGHFWSANSYLLKYTYLEGNTEKVLLYFWQGRDSSVNEKGTSAYLTKELDEKIAGTGKQIRVPQDFEPEHFLLTFKGKLCIHAGDHTPNWLDTITTTKIFDIRGTSAVNTFAKEVYSVKNVTLHSDHVFVFVTKTSALIWQGAKATQHGIAFANTFATATTRKVETFTEGSETDAFWAAIGSKISTHKTQLAYKPKLFVISDATGAVECDEMFEVVQDALQQNNAMILDQGDNVWVWFGPGSSILEQKFAMQTAKDYAAQASQFGSRLAASVPIWVTKAWQEPFEFKASFQAWSTTKQPKDKAALPEHKVPVDSVLKDYLREVYSFAELLKDPLPIGVDATKLEMYLTAEEFEKVLGMTRAQYDAIPKWKQEGIKKAAGLF